MISYGILTSSAGAQSYYQQEATTRNGEYYRAEETPSRWGGEGAALAGFQADQTVGKDALIATLDGKLHNPENGQEQQLGRIQNGKVEHRSGFDFTFSAPKSVSVVGLVGNDSRVQAAHEAAVERAMAYLEQHAETRVRVGKGEVEHRQTGNLVYAAFSHDTSRSQDPQIHTHVVVANATYDYQDSKWRSLDPDKLIKEMRTADAIYKNELSRELQKAGYDVQHGKNGPEIAGVSNEQRDVFSKRSEDMEREMLARGKTRETTTGKERNTIALDTRDAKRSVSRDELQGRWEGEAKAAGLDVSCLVDAAKERRGGAGQDVAVSEQRQTAGEAVSKAVAHLSEREMSFSRSALIASAHDFSKGQHSQRDIQTAIATATRDGEIVVRNDETGKESSITTPGGIKAEKEAAAMVRDGKGASDALMTGKAADKVLEASDKERGFRLNDGQRDAARLILSTKDQYVAVQGPAGSGKTTMLEAVREAAEKTGYTVRGMSAGAKQAAILERESGIKSQTVASFTVEQRKTVQQAEQIKVEGGTVMRLSSAIARNVASTNDVKIGASRVHMTSWRGMYVSNSTVAGDIRDVARDYKNEAANDWRQADTAKAGLSAAARYAGAALTEKVAKDSMTWRKGDVGDAAIARAAAAIRGAGKGVSEFREQQTTLAKADGSKQLWVVDEASQLSQKDMNTIMRQANECGAKVVFVGDKQQHQSVEAGRAYGRIQEAGIAKVELTEVNRQKDDIGIAAVKDVMAGDHKAAFEKLEKVEIKDNQSLISQLAKDYVASPDRDKTLIVTTTNANRQAINVAVRGELKESGVLGEREVSVSSLEKVDMTAAQAREASSYREGMIVQADRNYKGDGVQKGDMFRVTGVDEKCNAVVLTSIRTGEEKTWNPAHRTGYSASQEREIGMATGDKVRFTQNDRGLGVRNGEMGTVTKVDDGSVTVQIGQGNDAREIAISMQQSHHMTHGYAGTSYGAQGDTQQNAMIHIDAERGAGVGQRDFYVGVTRAREGTTVYTTNNERAADLISRTQEKTGAIEDKAAERSTVSIRNDRDGASKDSSRDSSSDSSKDVERSTSSSEHKSDDKGVDQSRSSDVSEGESHNVSRGR